MHQKDEHGEYRQTARWVDAWEGKGYSPGYCVCEVREYSDGTTRVHRGEPKYLVEQKCAEVHSLHAIYMRAARALGA